MMPMRLENWSAEDLEVYCAGPFLTTDRQTATKRWLEMSARVPDPELEGRKALSGREPSTIQSFRKQTELFANYRGTNPLDSELPQRGRRKMHSGKRAAHAEVRSMGDDFLHVAMSRYDDKSLSDNYLINEKTGRPEGRYLIEYKWSQAPEVCAAHRRPVANGRRKYCSDECAREGANAAKRALYKRRFGKWPADERGWYIQTWPPVIKPRSKALSLPPGQRPAFEPRFGGGVDVTGNTSVALALYGDTIIPLTRNGQIVAVTSPRLLFYSARSIPRPDAGLTRQLTLKNTYPNVWKITPTNGRLAC
ncbi:Uncharacterised protein [Mycobacteroides abscessus subsp. abscessus]|nr:Uncharacterised protein [Mycobacteroides abscessus subsp. abscessus]SLD78868.1 Uncharacterised protein [Mycobacteroides abscessus subsp. abscessus]